MNSKSEKVYTLEELKTMNAADMKDACQAERFITVSDRNWTAVLNLLSRSCSIQEAVIKSLSGLMTRPDAERYLEEMSRRNQAQLLDMRSEIDCFTQQAGRMSESFSSGADRLITNTEKSLKSMESSTESELRDMTMSTEKDLKETVTTARKWITATAIVCMGAILLLAALFGWAMLRKVLAAPLP